MMDKMTDFNISEIAPLCEEFGLTLDTLSRERLGLYGNLLLEWNEKMNLTAITEPREVLYKHFYDCLLLLKYVKPQKGAFVIDVGTGAGFPGMVLKIVRPDINITLLDGLNKRLVFLSEVLNRLSLTADIRHLRAEDGGKDPDLRESFDIACARAVAPLPVLAEYCIPFVKKGGVFAAMKGSDAINEALSAKNAYKVLGCEEPQVFSEILPPGHSRAFVIAKKISQTSSKYPRSGGKIKKNAL